MLRYWEIANICFTRNISYLPHVFIGPRPYHSPFIHVSDSITDLGPCRKLNALTLAD